MEIKYTKRTMCLGCGAHVSDADITEEEFKDLEKKLHLLIEPSSIHVATDEDNFKAIQVENLGQCKNCTDKD